ncbi:MAG TPA: FliM/FliN family flagellar motor switch protein, partial [Leptolinea sp.]
MLTQAEIDALLNGAIEIEGNENQEGVNLADMMGKAGQPKESSPSEKNVRPYNFWSPDRFSKEQIRAIELVNEELAERLTNSLPSFIRTNLRPRVVHTEQGRFHDFMADLAPTTLYHLVSLAPLPGQVAIVFSDDVNFVILEQRLGGASDSRGRNHSLTEIDQSLLQDLVENMLNDVKAAWGKVVSVEPKLIDSTVNQHWVQMMMGNERVLMVTFEMMIKDTTGTMSFYIPYSLLKPVANELNPHVIITGKKEQIVDYSARQTNLESLYRTEVPLKVILGNVRLTIKEMSNLAVGDVLVLDSTTHQDLMVQVNGTTRFKGRIGKQANHLAVQISGPINIPKVAP